jgi:hypothetical protein
MDAHEVYAHETHSYEIHTLEIHIRKGLRKPSRSPVLLLGAVLVHTDCLLHLEPSLLFHSSLDLLSWFNDTSIDLL